MICMISVNECLRADTNVYLTRDRSLKKGLFYKDETPELFISFGFNNAILFTLSQSFSRFL